jgi:hypothetical protein
VRRATKICRQNYSLVKIGTTSTANSLVEILRSKYRKEERKDKQVTSAKLKKKKEEENKRGDIRKQRNYYYFFFKETSIYSIFSTLCLICSNR